MLAAWRGGESQADELMVATRDQVLARGEGVGLTVIEWAGALLANGAGRYEDALVMAQQAAEHPDELAVSTWALVEAVEAASRLGKIEIATAAKGDDGIDDGAQAMCNRDSPQQSAPSSWVTRRLCPMPES